MKKTLTIILLFLLNQSISQIYAQSEVNYDCLITDPFAEMIFIGYQTEKEAVNAVPEEVSPKEEMKLGDQLYEELIKKQKFITEGANYDSLQGILIQLLKNRMNDKSDLKYKIHLIEDSTINAFTAGGHIFLYTGILDYSKSDGEIAFVIAHEIGHNEKKHINLILKRIKIAGQFGDILYSIKQITSASFNQFAELEADCYAIDLCYASNYDPCEGTQFWKRMANDGKEKPNMFEKMFRTHPFSIDRYNCLLEYLEQFPDVKCD